MLLCDLFRVLFSKEGKLFALNSQQRQTRSPGTPGPGAANARLFLAHLRPLCPGMRSVETRETILKDGNPR